ncbi:hypothetical protein [Proteiniphilum sp. UBA5384]|uniref:hypothetical protein n=1 Tax=Proteiniphilum sp. UBA5384 TaxID=1947279 RepID=UPI0025CE75CF|nr:hypothetical protein [Proteiniphilum sp. UBA5384]
MTSCGDDDEPEINLVQDIAIHRYDAKTNGASVLETGFTGLSTLKVSGEIPQGDYVAEEWTTGKIDMPNDAAYPR